MSAEIANADLIQSACGLKIMASSENLDPDNYKSGITMSDYLCRWGPRGV